VKRLSPRSIALLTVPHGMDVDMECGGPNPAPCTGCTARLRPALGADRSGLGSLPGESNGSAEPPAAGMRARRAWYSCPMFSVSLPTHRPCPVVPSRNAWHAVRVHLVVAGASSSVVVRDGQNVGALSMGLSLGTTEVGRIVVGDSSSGPTCDLVADDVAVTTA
jgi:hypothetical protein